MLHYMCNAYIYNLLSKQNSAECMWHQQKQCVTGGKSDPYVVLCFAGAIKILNYKILISTVQPEVRESKRIHFS